jgi:hypothetical protein
MWLEAVLSKDDLRKVAAEFAPLTVRLGEEGELSLGVPSDVSLVPDKGLRIACGARLHWPLLGISVPITITLLTVIVRPVVEKQSDGDALVFHLELEHADFAMIPSALDTRVTERVNKELAAKHIELAWTFSHTLSHVFPLPAVLKTAASFGLEVAWGEVRVTTEALVFAISFKAVIRRRADSAIELEGATVGEKSTPELLKPLPLPARPELTLGRIAAFTGIGALALGCAYTIGHARSRGQRR